MGIKIEVDWNQVDKDLGGIGQVREGKTDLSRLEYANQELKEVQTGGRLNTEAEKSDLDEVIIRIDELITRERSNQDIGGQEDRPAKRNEKDIRN